MARYTLPDPPAHVASQMIEECVWVLRANVVAKRLPRAETAAIITDLEAIRPRLRALTDGPSTSSK